MATLTPRELAVRERIEALIRLMEPGLNLLLAIGDRVSRLVEREESWEAPSPTGMPDGAYPRRGE